MGTVNIDCVWKGDCCLEMAGHGDAADFLHWGGRFKEPVDESETAADDEATSAGHVFINMGSSGIEVKDALPEEDEEGEGGGENVGEDSFAARRLSVHNPYDEDWNDAEEGADAPDDADDK